MSGAFKANKRFIGNNISILFIDDKQQGKKITFLQPNKLLSTHQPKAQKRGKRTKKLISPQSTTTRNKKNMLFSLEDYEIF